MENLTRNTVIPAVCGALVPRLLLALVCLLASGRVVAEEAALPDTLATAPDTLGAQPKAKTSWWRNALDRAYAVVREFNRTDHDYITPQRYNYALMLQGTQTYERYTLRSNGGQTFAFAPKPSLKLGPYFGWRWVFMGYQLDMSRLQTDTRREFDLSLYSSLVGIDLFSRKSSSGYRIKSASKGKEDYGDMLLDMPFDGIEVGIKGFNLYYICNHKKFSYPAAFSQSTMQRRSAGSALFGIGYTHHNIKLDHERLRELVDARTNGTVAVDSSFNFNEVNYTDASISGGYAYNYAFAHNWLFAVSLSAALGYKRSRAEIDHTVSRFPFYGFRFENFNIDGVGRFGLVWNNMRWFAGASAIVHTYNYNKDNFSTNNTFGSFNLYVGVNFGDRHPERKRKQRRQDALRAK